MIWINVGCWNESIQQKQPNTDVCIDIDIHENVNEWKQQIVVGVYCLIYVDFRFYAKRFIELKSTFFFFYIWNTLFRLSLKQNLPENRMLLKIFMMICNFRFGPYDLWDSRISRSKSQWNDNMCKNKTISNKLKPKTKETLSIIYYYQSALWFHCVKTSAYFVSFIWWWNFGLAVRLFMCYLFGVSIISSDKRMTKDFYYIWVWNLCAFEIDGYG